MGEKFISTPSRTKEILEKYSLGAKKSLGQNFIVDTNILNKIVRTGNVDKQTNVIEVGPGIGALTEQLAIHGKHVLAFEIDERLLTVLEDTLSPYQNVTVIHDDILKADIKETVARELPDAKRLVVIANLPYYVTTPILFEFLYADLPIDEMVFMMQKEVAQRITAKPGTKAYGSLSIAVQYYMEAAVAFTVPKTVFNPMPNVESAIVHLTKRDVPPVLLSEPPVFFQLVRNAFVQRRKTIWNNLQAAYGKDTETKDKMVLALEEAEIDPSRRGETLTIEEFGKLANAFAKRDISALNQKNKENLFTGSVILY
ncbi:16S rRNA (adenine(1518)-N(6)/adenine(1519)-N(6))-dimethyltransferase RsmA [Lacticigenium naphthae]|uniref:16S rRNA (adenine(1518)-N(6)/adenine(1519)-N(6))- dimethyltransferase RsmA n=1 Tax=Lacticigenium naphthae TaxID=515351 RepID=UPI00041486EA|nr:16S rRNA (adenine(1518)-N(6)/adenine(1519)-N(6))-dimethyltransferase RsmA [Lacticigenium naphthae]